MAATVLSPATSFVDEVLGDYNTFRVVLRINGLFYFSEAINRQQALRVLANQPKNLHSMQATYAVGGVQVSTWENI